MKAPLRRGRREDPATEGGWSRSTKAAAATSCTAADISVCFTPIDRSPTMAASRCSLLGHAPRPSRAPHSSPRTRPFLAGRPACTRRSSSGAGLSLGVFLYSSSRAAASRARFGRGLFFLFWGILAMTGAGFGSFRGAQPNYSEPASFPDAACSLRDAPHLATLVPPNPLH